MIVELFGHAGAGKTTFAHALSENLRDRGYVVTLFLSHRPSEPAPSVYRCGSDANRPQSAVLARLMRPAIEVLALAHHPLAISRDVRRAVTLMELLPPKNMFWSMRMGQYIVRLSHAWQQASQADHIVLFDQAFVQAVCSLISHGRALDEASIAQALDYVPKPDLLVRLNAPHEILKARLRDRIWRQGKIERLFEPHQGTKPDLIHIIDTVQELLRKRGQPVVRAASLDQDSLRDGVALVGSLINPAARVGCGATAAIPARNGGNQCDGIGLFEESYHNE